MRGLRAAAFASLVASLVVTSLSWLGTVWRERGLGLELIVSGADDDRGRWTRRERAAGVGGTALEAAELPSGAGLHAVWTGVWHVSRTGVVEIRARVEGDLRVGLDGVDVLVLSGSRDLRRHGATVSLERGFHDLRVEWFAPARDAGLSIRWAQGGGRFSELEREALLPVQPSSLRFALYRLVGLGRRLVLPFWGLTLVLVAILAARRDLLWDLDDPGRPLGADASAAVGPLARGVPWPLAVPAAILAILLPALLLVLHTVVWRADTDLRYLPASLRYWEELSIASTQYLEDRNPSRFEPASIASWAGGSFRVQLSRLVEAQVTSRSLRPWEFWKSLSPGPGFKREPLRHRGIEDVGRSSLTRVGFHVVGGIAPFLLLWLGPLCALPLLVWVVWESLRVGRLVIGLTFGLLFACSPFVAELLSLYYSPAGFYVLGLLLVLALALFVVLGPAPRFVPLLVRCGLFGVAFAVCTLCRSGVGLFAPVAVALLAWGVARGWSAPRARFGVAVLGLALMFGPYAGLRPDQHHSVWITVWEGLGDFDRVKGYVFSDRSAKARLIEAGATDIPRHRGLASMEKDDYSQESSFMRAEVLEDIRADPGWYLAILARRLFVSLTQYKLMDRGNDEESSFTPATSGNEGAIDVYYHFTRTADWVGMGPWLYELPVPILWTPLLAWLGWQRRRLLSSSSPVWVVIAVGACALTVPVVITVAGAFETQSFVLVYYLGAALLCDSVVARAGRWRVGDGGSSP